MGSSLCQNAYVQKMAMPHAWHNLHVLVFAYVHVSYILMMCTKKVKMVIWLLLLCVCYVASSVFPLCKVCYVFFLVLRYTSFM